MPDRSKALAYHEAGHAIAMVRYGVKIATCTINTSELDGLSLRMVRINRPAATSDSLGGPIC
jgi:hypothetical protein